MIMYNNNDWAYLYSNLRKAHRRKGVVLNVLVKTGVTIKYQSMMYKAVFQAVLMYGSESWVAKDMIITILEVFYYRIAGQVAGMTSRRGDRG